MKFYTFPKVPGKLLNYYFTLLIVVHPCTYHKCIFYILYPFLPCIIYTYLSLFKTTGESPIAKNSCKYVYTRKNSGLPNKLSFKQCAVQITRSRALYHPLPFHDRSNVPFSVRREQTITVCTIVSTPSKPA